MGLIFFVLVVGYALIVFWQVGLERAAIISGTAPTAAVTAPPDDFSETGTLLFYPNNVGPIPYLFYEDAQGGLHAKALTFRDLPPEDFTRWAGGRITVLGHTEKEHVVVRQITYIASP